MGHVSLITLAIADRVLIQIEDECGGLPPGEVEHLFRLFEQQGADRTGLGLGLAISRQGVEDSGGVIHVRNLPGRGCVFTVDLPGGTDSQRPEFTSQLIGAVFGTSIVKFIGEGLLASDKLAARMNPFRRT